MTASKSRVIDVRFEHHHDGLGLGVATPRISWSFPSAPGEFEPNWMQLAYQLETVFCNEKDVFHAQVCSRESLLVPWPARPLKSRETAKVRVRVHGRSNIASGSQSDAFEKAEEFSSRHSKELDADYKWSAWSEWATVEAALLERDDWKAVLIEPSSTLTKTTENGSLIPVRFISPNFQLPATMMKARSSSIKARLYVTAHGVYQARLNGKVVGDQCMSPGWTSYKHRLQYQTYAVEDLIHDASSIQLEVHVAAGWFASALGWAGGRRCRFGDTLGLLAQLHVDFDLGEGQAQETLILSTNTSWKSTHSRITRSEIYQGETYDARRKTQASISYDDLPPVVVGPFPSAQLISPEAPPVRVTQEIKPVDIIETPSGKMILDFGQNLVGKLRVNHLNKPESHQVQFSHAEVLEHGELGRRPLRFASSTDTIISSGEVIENWVPLFTFHGYRYVEVDGWSPDDEEDPLTKDSVTSLVLHTDMKRTGWFECSHPLINKLHENAVWSMRGNFLSIPSDCPQRDERLGWTGDIQIFSPSASFLYDTCSILGGWIQDVAAEQKANGDGVPPFVVPDVITFDKGVDDDRWWPHLPNAVWDDVVVLLPWDLYCAFGDVSLLERQYESMRAWIDRGVVRGADGLWATDIWQLGDWLDPAAPPSEPGNGKTDPVLVADAYLVRITKVMSQVATALGLAGDRYRYSEEHKNLLRRFRNKYLTPAGLLASDSQTAYALAFVNEFFESEQQASLAADRLIRAVRQAQFRVSTGFAGTPIILHALSRIGRPQFAYRMLLEKQCPSWMYPVLMGATTIWERWDSMLADGSINPGEMTSFNHYALGSVVNWLHEQVGGISPMKFGWNDILVRPVPGATITRCQVKHISPYGAIECRWELVDSEFSLELVVPPNCQAYVVMPNVFRVSILDDNPEGVWVGGGEHKFKCQVEGHQDKWPLEAPRPPFWPAPMPEAV